MTSQEVRRNPVEELAEEFLERYRRGERPALSEYTHAHPELADEIRDLFPALVMMEEAGPRQDGPAGACGGAVTADGKALERLGDYRIIREVARGGMGVVYEAEQETLGRHVALKVLPFHAANDPVRLKRFRREARSAARLHHTNIVPVFDVGVWRAGDIGPPVHYFAMQFIQGQGLDEVLAEVKRLRQKASGAASARRDPASGAASARRDLTLSLVGGLVTGEFAPNDKREMGDDERKDDSAQSSFIVPDSSVHSSQSGFSTESDFHYYRSVARVGLQVAEALSYAHGQKVLHRDIKPSNLLLDRQGTVWVTDFGLAKDEGEDLTRTGDIVGTLRYMAPERFSGYSEPRSDIYSLGMTLYELLTLHAGFEDSDRARLVQRIAHEEPPRPRTLDRRIPRDLETIVLKSIDKEPEHRYASAGDLAEDLRRFLGDLPIQARRTSTWERTWRWCRRNRALASLTAAVAALVVVAIVGLVISNVLITQERDEKDIALRNERAALGKATEQEELAKGNLERADQNLAVALEALDDVYMKDVEDRILRDRHMTQAERESLEKGLKFYERFAQQNSGHAELERVTAKAHRRAGFLRLELRDWKEAEAHFAKAIPVFEKLADESPDIADFRQELARCLDLLCEVRRWARLNKKAEPTCRRALALWEKLVGDYPQEPSYRAALAHTLRALGQVLAMENASGRLEETERVMREALRRYKALAAEYPGRLEYRSEAAFSHNELAHYVLGPSGRAREGAENREQATAIYERLVADKLLSRAVLGDSYLNLGDSLKDAGQVPQAEEAYNQALRAYEKLAVESPAGDYQLRVGWTHVYLGNLFRDTQRPKEAEVAYRTAVSVYTKLIADPSTHPSVMWRLPGLAHDLAKLLRGTGRAVEADAVLRQAADQCLAALRRYDQWPPDRNLPGDHWDFVNSYQNLGQVLMEAGRFQEAAEAYQRAIGFWEKVYYDLSNADLWHRQSLVHIHIELGRTLAAAGKREQSESAFRKAAEVHRQQETEFGSKPEYQRQLADGQASAAALLQKAGRLDDAITAYREAIDSYEKLAAQFPREPSHRAQQSETLLNLGHLLRNNKRQQEAEQAYRQSLDAGEKVAEMSPAELWHAHMPAASCYHLGDLMLEMKKYNEAAEFYGRAMALYQKLLVRFPQPSYVQGEFRHIVQALPTALRKAGRLREAEKSFREALAVWEKLVKDTSQRDYLVHLYSTWDTLDLVLAELAEQVQKDATLPEADRQAAAQAYAEKANQLRESVQAALDAALPAVRKTIESKPDAVKAQVELGNTLSNIGRYDEAITAYRKAIALKPDSRAAHNNLGNALHRQGKLEEALAEYRKALAIDPKCGAPLWNLSRLLANGPDHKHRDPCQAIELAKRGIELEGHAGWWQTLAWGYYRAGAWDESVAAMQKSVELNKGSALADSRAELGDQSLFLAMAHWRLGHQKEAREWYDRGAEWVENNTVRLDRQKRRATRLEDDPRNIRAEAAELMGIK